MLVPVAVNVSVCPTVIELEVLSNVIPDTRCVALVTVTSQAAFVLLPSLMVAVIVAWPSPIAVTFPLLSTVAIAGLLDVHVSCASAGIVVAVNY